MEKSTLFLTFTLVLCVLFSLVLYAFWLCVIALRTNKLATIWFNQQPFSLISLKRKRSPRIFFGFKADAFKTCSAHRLFEIQIYDHDMHRERICWLRVNGVALRAISACKVEHWQDQGLPLIRVEKKLLNLNINKFTKGRAGTILFDQSEYEAVDT